MRIAIHIRYALFALLTFIILFCSSGAGNLRLSANMEVARSSITTEHKVAGSDQRVKQDIEQFSVSHVVSAGQSVNSFYPAKEQAKQLLLSHYLSYLRNAPVYTSFNTVSQERNNFHHLSPRLLIFPKHWFG